MEVVDRDVVQPEALQRERHPGPEAGRRGLDGRLPLVAAVGDEPAGPGRRGRRRRRRARGARTWRRPGGGGIRRPDPHAGAPPGQGIGDDEVDRRERRARTAPDHLTAVAAPSGRAGRDDPRAVPQHRTPRAAPGPSLHRAATRAANRSMVRSAIEQDEPEREQDEEGQRSCRAARPGSWTIASPSIAISSAATDGERVEPRHRAWR